MTRILLIRHCESTGQAPDAPLTAHGFAQAETLAQRLENQPIDYICCSPYLRARATIAPLATRAGRPAHIDPRLAERHLSPAPIPNWRDVVRASFSDPLYKLAGGESGADTLHRGKRSAKHLLSVTDRAA